MLNAQSKTALFIDGANLHATAKALGFDIDFKKLLKEMHSRGNLLRAFYYAAILEDQAYSSVRPLVDWLDYNGYTAVTKLSKEYVDAAGRRKIKSDMDIELAVGAMEIAAHVDEIVLFSGDGNFRSLVEALQRRGLEAAVGVSDERPGHPEHPRISCEWPVGKLGQLAVVAGRQIGADLADLPFHEMIVVDQPFRRRGNCACLANRLGDCAMCIEEHRCVVGEPVR